MKLVKVALPWNKVSAKSCGYYTKGYLSRELMDATYNIKSEVRGVGDIGSCAEVWLALLGSEGDLAVGDGSAIEQVQAVHGNSLLKGNAPFPGQARRLDLGAALDGDAESLVGSKPDVEGVEGVGVLDLNLLANVDQLVLVAVGGGEGDVEERRVTGKILEIHDSLKGINVCLDRAIGGDGGVDL